MILGANLDWLFLELPLLERPRAAADAGFDAVEVLRPYDISPDALALAVRDAGVRLTLINMPFGNTFGTAALAGSEPVFRHEFRMAAYYARAAGAERLHILSGITRGADATATLVNNLDWALETAPDLHLTIEPLNGDDTPGYFLNDFHQAADIVSRIGSRRLRLQFDIYHAIRIHTAAIGLWEEYGNMTGHVQIASAPTRNEPDEAAIAILRKIAADGYSGCISGEYRPAGATIDGLGWLKLARSLEGDPS